MSWEKLPAIKGRMGGCANSGVRPDTFWPDMVIAVGFGLAHLTRDGEVVWCEPHVRDDSEYMTGADAEISASSAPDHDWRIVLYGPLVGTVYQRHGPGLWVLVEQNKGFA